MACTSGRTATSSKESGKTASSMARGRIYSRTVTYTLACTCSGSQRATESIAGRMGVSIKGSLNKVSRMVKASGRRMLSTQIVISMKENMKMIRKMGREFSLGRVGTSIRDSTRMTREMAMVKCFGQMGLCIRVSGVRVFNMVSVR